MAALPNTASASVHYRLLCDDSTSTPLAVKLEGASGGHCLIPLTEATAREITRVHCGEAYYLSSRPVGSSLVLLAYGLNIPDIGVCAEFVHDSHKQETAAEVLDPLQPTPPPPWRADELSPPAGTKVAVGTYYQSALIGSGVGLALAGAIGHAFVYSQREEGRNGYEEYNRLNNSRQAASILIGTGAAVFISGILGLIFDD